LFGSWPSTPVQSGLIVVWIGYNGYATTRYVSSAGFDPYALTLRNVPFCPPAAYAAPLIR
jgi:uncharacterized membrane protein